MASMPQSKDIEEQIGLKNKTQPHVAYKRLISLKKINIGLESRAGKKFSNKQIGVAIPISDKVDFRLK
jgi:hypothetical protein